MAAMNKRKLRAHLRSLHMGRDERDAQSERLCRHILQSSAFRDSRVLGGYMALPREADVTPVLKEALRQGKTVALPLCGDAPHMTLRLVSSMDDLIVGAYGILEPASNAPVISAQDVDLLLVPLEGIDAKGFRLGKGGGYYDRLLAQNDVLTIGCALTWQWAEWIPHDPWDVPLTACADQDGITFFER